MAGAKMPEMGVCAATRVALPARFLWEAYRGMLGRERVPSRSPFDKGERIGDHSF